MKNCQEIEQEINEIRKIFQKKKKSPDVIEILSKILVEEVKCNSIYLICDTCNCSKKIKRNNNRDEIPVESEKDRNSGRT
jgi:hypothetical protein